MKSRRCILDTSRLIGHWRRCRSRSSEQVTPTIAVEWAKDLIQMYDTKAIVTPVYIEFIAGARSQAELHLAQSYLSAFEIADDGKVLAEDWKEAQRLATRVPRNGKPRQLGDCLIRAIATRLRCELSTVDRDFPRP